MVRSLIGDTARYGEASRPEEFTYDMPYQWGSKRTGPDLHRVGGRYPDVWHYQHMLDPRTTSPGSNMPSYAFLKERPIDYDMLARNVRAMSTLGVPYAPRAVLEAEGDARAEAQKLADGLKAQDVSLDPNSELAALIAYLQGLGKTTQTKETPDVSNSVSRAER
jgi:cytochrome c oxidase cbb3-type subunit I/II